MSRKPNYFKLGLFIVISCLLLAGFLIALGAGSFFKKELLMETCFEESVQGLDMGSEVKYKGVRIGRVQQITTPTKFYGVPSDAVLVIFSIDEDTYAGQQGKNLRERMEQAIDRGLKVRLGFKGVTGVAFLEMDYSSSKKTDMEIQWTPKYLYIPSRKSQIANIEDALNNIMDNMGSIHFGDITRNFEQLLDVLNQKAKGIDTDEISRQMKSFLEEIRTTNMRIANAMDSKEIKALIQDAHESFSNIKKLLESVQKSLPPALEDFSQAANNANKITDNLHEGMLAKPGEVSERIEQFMDTMNHTAKMLENMVWTNSDAVGKMIEDFSRSAENLDHLINDLQYYPGRVLMEKPPRHYGNDQNGKQNSKKNDEE